MKKINLAYIIDDDEIIIYLTGALLKKEEFCSRTLTFTDGLQAIERLKDVDIAIADYFLTPLNHKVFESAKKLKLLAINTTGYDGLDISAANDRDIKLANVPGFATDSVAEQTIALMFSSFWF